MTVHVLDPGGWGRFDGFGRIRVEVDFGVGFYNVTGWCAGLTVTRGRRSRLGAFFASQATLRLDNGDARFSPWNPWSPYNLSGQPVTVARPNTPLRILGRNPAGLVVPLFYGWADAWVENANTHRNGRTSGHYVDVSATDGFKRLAQADRIAGAPVGAGELAGARIHRILDSALWPVASRRIATGSVTMQATTLAGVALDELQAVALADGGYFYMDGAGNAVYADQATVDAAGAVRYAFTNTGEAGTIGYTSGLAPVADDRVFVNTVTIGRAGGPSATAQDTASQQRNGLLVWSRTNLPFAVDAVAGQLAALYLERASSSMFGIDRVELQPAGCPAGPERTAAWEAVLALEPLMGVRVVYQPDNGVAGMDATAPVDEIRHALTADSWTTTFRTSAVAGLVVVDVVDPPTNMRVTGATGTTMTWAWDNDPDGYDNVFLRLDNGAATMTTGTTEGAVIANLEPGSTHTLCVWGRRGLVNSGEVCATGQTVIAPEQVTPPGPQNPPTSPTSPPGTPPGGTFPITDPNPGGGDTCGWIYVLSRFDAEVGWTDVDLGDVPDDQVGHDWRPDYAYLPGATYRLCFQLLCAGAQQGGSTCYTWLEPSAWDDGDPCVWGAPPSPSPVAALEVCGPTNEIADVISGSRLTRAEMFSHAYTPGPYGGDYAMVAGNTAAGTGRLAYGAVFALGKLGAGAGVDAPGSHTVFTVAGWVLIPSTPTSSYAAVVLGSNLEFLILFEPEANTCRIRAASLDFLGRRRTWDLSEAANDVIPQGVWTHVAIAYGNTAGTADGGIRLWIDGVLRSAINLGEGFLLAPHDGFVQLGAQPALSVAHWAFWDQLLSNNEVAGIANNDPNPDPAPQGTTISIATTLVVPGAYRAANGGSVRIPANEKVTWKYLWRDSRVTPPAANGIGLPMQGLDLAQHVWTSDVRDDGTYSDLSLNYRRHVPADMPPNAAFDWIVYYGPGDTTMDGTVLEANMGALYMRQFAGTLVVRIGPGRVPKEFTIDTHYTGLGDTDFYRFGLDLPGYVMYTAHRYDDEATHTRPLFPAPLPPPPEDDNADDL